MKEFFGGRVDATMATRSRFRTVRFARCGFDGGDVEIDLVLYTVFFELLCFLIHIDLRIVVVTVGVESVLCAKLTLFRSHAGG